MSAYCRASILDFVLPSLPPVLPPFLPLSLPPSQARYLPELLDALVFQRLAVLQAKHHPVGVTE